MMRSWTGSATSQKPFSSVRNRNPAVVGRVLLCILREGLDAVGADLGSLAGHLRPLEVGLFTGLSCRVVVTAQKDTTGDHAGTFMTCGAFDGHGCVLQ